MCCLCSFLNQPTVSILSAAAAFHQSSAYWLPFITLHHSSVCLQLSTSLSLFTFFPFYFFTTLLYLSVICLQITFHHSSILINYISPNYLFISFLFLSIISHLSKLLFHHSSVFLTYSCFFTVFSSLFCLHQSYISQLLFHHPSVSSICLLFISFLSSSVICLKQLPFFINLQSISLSSFSLFVCLLFILSSVYYVHLIICLVSTSSSVFCIY